MRELEAFRPYLTGAVLEGTAGRYAEVEIDLFPESAKEVEIFFLNHAVNYEHREPRRNQPDAPRRSSSSTGATCRSSCASTRPTSSA
jgi:hypothetical protein